MVGGFLGENGGSLWEKKAMKWLFPQFNIESDGKRILFEHFFRTKREYFLITWDGKSLVIREPNIPDHQLMVFAKDSWTGAALELEDWHYFVKELIISADFETD